MKKRNIIKNLLLFSVIALSTACNSLDQDPSDQHTDDTFWQSEANSELLVNTAYAQMYGADKMWNDEALADNVIQARTDNDQRKMRNGLATSSLGIYGSEWKWAYEGIKTCHKYLENIDRVPNMEASLKNTRKAEIRYIRASLFMRLAYFYGDVPFFTKDITLEEAKTIKRTSKSTILSFVHQELDEITNVLPAKSSSVTKGRITKAAATALQARAYLYESNWAMVEKYTSSLINEQSVYGNYSLFNNYETLFQSQNNYNDEVILECGFATSNRSWGEMRSRVPLSQGANLNACAPIQELVDSYLTVNGKSIKNDPTYNAANPYENRDPRFVASIVYDGFVWGKDSEGKDIIIRTAYGTGTADSWESVSSNRSVTGYYIRKYYDPESRKTLKDYQQTNNIIMLRYADVLLMYAEAMFEQGKMSENVWNQTIKKIRSRAGFTEATALNYPSVSDSDMRELLHNERRTELVFEGLRYYDIVRWKAGTTLLNKTVHGAKFASNNTAYITLDTWKFDEGRDYLWSVPMEQMVMNPNLKPNNPGY